MNAPDVVDVVALGESMVTFLPTRAGRLADVPSFDRAIGGAESNVACGLAAAGHAVRWVSRVGSDGFGDHLVETVGGYGVDVSAVGRDSSRPTGVYFRTAGDRATDAHEVAYYRAGSAASAMSVENVDPVSVRAARVLHLSGITAALSEGCLALLRSLMAPGEDRPLVSFDVNHRAGLWRDADGPRVLLELARGADIVFVGEDEAEEAWGISGGPSEIRAALPEPGVLVVKQGGVGATAFVSGAGRWGLVAPRGGAAHRRSPAPLKSDTGPQIQAAAPSPAPTGGTPQAGVSDTGPWPQGAGPSPLPASPAGGRAAQGASASVEDGTSRAGAGDTDPRPQGAGPAPRPTPRRGGSRSAENGTHPRSVPELGTFVPALRVDVVATTGAGDAFAAGFLSATLRGLPLKTRLRHGHLHAAAALTSPGDLATPPTRDTADRLAAVADEAWGTLRLGPGWTQAGTAPEEVRTP
ncbi:PfkB family carbohydrate kinase [Streptomyces canus]|uniref:sugar kinase n=1 Tax=Streptomyces canus TaxID=58343 RepID=UPI00225B77C3|nr:PfkB family carbohydrate kinase [Streptomyces canus]MCX5258266.1 PfkB family carbohydrate kinase [Streptomyces canus]